MFEVKKELNVSNILHKVGEIDIFKMYCSPFKEVGRKFSSELRDDPNPSAIISEFNGKLWYKDFGETEKAADCFSYIMRKYSITFIEALGMINSDFKLGLQEYVKYNKLPYNKEKIKTQFTNLEKCVGLTQGKQVKIITPIYRNWLNSDVKYWKNNYYIDIARLKRFGVRPIKAFLLNDKYIKTDPTTYIFQVTSEDGVVYYKIYSPLNKFNKWLSNCTKNQYLGFDYLPWIGDIVVITKSLKDIMVLSLFDIPAIAPQSESQVISYYIYTNLKRRFKNIFILYDNDVSGRKGTSLTLERYSDIIPIFIPNYTDKITKDISDFIFEYRYNETYKLINRIILNNDRIKR